MPHLRRLPLFGLALALALGARCSPPQPQCEAGTGAQVVELRCTSCHSSSLTGADRNAATPGVDFDTEAEVQKHADRIRYRALEVKTMPLGTPLADCEAALLDGYLAALAAGPCLPDCTGRACGDDGCGGQCGSCPAGEGCDQVLGSCTVAACTPDCTGKSCGPNGCGGSCGTCGAGSTCGGAGSCVCAPQCTGRTCGPDACGGTCGACATNAVCNSSGACTCIPSCAGKQCGSDGCGGACGTCTPPFTCTAGNQCVCQPNCAGRQCGPDGCGGTCGASPCAGSLVCNTQTGRCVLNCVPNCTGRTCGDDGCGGSCGTCDGGSCNTLGTCACVPDCTGKQCGADGCGGSCGACSGGLVCSVTGQCGCTPDCTGRVCGGDGCGGSCGACDAGSCNAAGQCGCVPTCNGATCGPDGCGGACGTCNTAQSCTSGQCVYASKQFTADVWPILQANGCGGLGCHSGARPAENLDLSSSSIAFAQLVNVTSAQCSSKKRVVPSDVAASYLVNKLLGTGMCFGSQMPKAGVSLAPAELDTIRAWIATGAAP